MAEPLTTATPTAWVGSRESSRSRAGASSRPFSVHPRRARRQASPLVGSGARLLLSPGRGLVAGVWATEIEESASRRAERLAKKVSKMMTMLVAPGNDAPPLRLSGRG